MMGRESPIAAQKPLCDRRWLQARLRTQNRLARQLRRMSDFLYRDSRRLTEEAVVAYRKANGTWPDADHPYKGMRG